MGDAYDLFCKTGPNMLRYVAQILPSVFSRGTKFERC